MAISLQGVIRSSSCLVPVRVFGNGAIYGSNKSKMAATAMLKKFQVAISPQPVVRSTSCFVLVWGSVVRYPRYLDTYRRYLSDDTSIAKVTIYSAIYRSSKKYREMAQVSRVSTIPRVSYHWATSRLQAYDAKTNVIKSLTVKYCASSSHLVSHQVLLHCLSLGSIVIKEGLTPRGQRTRTQISDFCRLEI